MNSMFSANEPNLGYLYQIRTGLLLLMRTQNDEANLLNEKLDDINIETPNTLHMYQTKLHIKSVANLTDASPDFWKTIRVWCEGIKSKQLDLNNCMFNLITTASAPAGSIPFELRISKDKSRDVDNILLLLKNVIHYSKNETNKAAYDSFSSLRIDEQKKMIENITVIDSSVDITEAKKEIIQFLKYSTYKEKVNALFERLEGWYINEVILQLLNNRNSISKQEVLNKIHQIADTLRADNLPADFPVSIATNEEKLSPYRHYKFVKQLQAIQVNSKQINLAISDYYRAYSQKSKWLRDGLINPSDEMQYDSKLFDDWERKYSIIEDTLNMDDDTQRLEGKKFYEKFYVNTIPNINIKERFNEQYMITGSCQMLSDKKKIGWHPNFKNII
jgi:hypothetical protein